MPTPIFNPVYRPVISGMNRADGLTTDSGTREGTATPVAARIISNRAGTNGTNLPIVEEDPESPEIERAEQCTITHRFRMPWNEALTRMETLGRGAHLLDDGGNRTRVLSTRVQHQRGGFALLTCTAEATSFDVPWDTFGIVPVELGVNILKHPRYVYSLNGSTEGEWSRNQQTIRALQLYMENPSPVTRNALAKQIKDSLVFCETGHTTNSYFLAGTAMCKYAALEIIQKHWRGEETPYLTGYQVTWASYYWRPPYLNPGGYIENPISNGGLPDYFHNPAYPADSTATVFDDIAKINPQCYSSTGYPAGSPVISWLRKADELQFERTWFKLTRTWIGSPVGYWDAEFYAATKRPDAVTDYRPFSTIDMPKLRTT